MGDLVVIPEISSNGHPQYWFLLSCFEMGTLKDAALEAGVQYNGGTSSYGGRYVVGEGGYFFNVLLEVSGINQLSGFDWWPEYICLFSIAF